MTKGQCPLHGTFNHTAPAEMGRPCHADVVQPTPAPYPILRVAAGTASCWRSEEALLRSIEGNIEEVLNSSCLARDTGSQ